MNSRMFKSFVLLVVALATAAGSQPRFQGSLQLAAGLLQGAFKENTGNDGFGLTGEFFYSPSRSIFSIGVSAGFLIYGMESRRQPLSSEFPDFTIKVSTDNSMVLAQLVLRLQNPTGRLRPYVEGVAGLNYLYTETRIENVDDWYEDDRIAGKVDFDDTAFNYGAGGGIQWDVYTAKPREGQEFHPLSVALDFQAKYLIGEQARYLKEGSVHRENGKVLYDVKESKTDLVLIQIGAAVRF